VEWSYLSVTDGEGTTTQLTADGYTYPVALDTGYTASVLPDDIFNVLASALGVTQDTAGNYIMSCEVPAGSFTFGFGSGPDVYIDVPLTEIAIPRSSGDCLFGFQPQGNNVVISFGDTFLRSAYAFYNFDDLTISLAQAT
jgi:hypothetical protein